MESTFGAKSLKVGIKAATVRSIFLALHKRDAHDTLAARARGESRASARAIVNPTIVDVIVAIIYDPSCRASERTRLRMHVRMHIARHVRTRRACVRVSHVCARRARKSSPALSAAKTRSTRPVVNTLRVTILERNAQHRNAAGARGPPRFGSAVLISRTSSRRPSFRVCARRLGHFRKYMYVWFRARGQSAPRRRRCRRRLATLVLLYGWTSFPRSRDSIAYFRGFKSGFRARARRHVRTHTHARAVLYRRLYRDIFGTSFASRRVINRRD